MTTPPPDDQALPRGTAPVSAPPSTASMPHPGPRRFSSRDLLGGQTEVEIEHETQVYRLRRTALGKLILTK